MVADPVKHPNIMSSVVPHFFCEMLDLAETVLALKGESGHAKGSATGKNVGILKKFIAENHARWRLGKMSDGSVVQVSSVLEGMQGMSASAVSSSASSSADSAGVATWPNLNDAGESMFKGESLVEDVKDNSSKDLASKLADSVVKEAAEAAAAVEQPTVVGA